ncbi:MAG: hypothetical protein O2955_07525 [Planctomycetota bacterium]|nr:hypothetical protein [Planctomycetota bacterium]MDA1212349.1 hypothetical protein [Planctomycetota bacterium]
MSGGFAGAKSVDGRRRRRLAGGTEPLPSVKVDYDLLTEFTSKPSPAEFTPPALSVASFVPRQHWKIGLAGFCGVLLILGLADLAGRVIHADFPGIIAGKHLFSADEGTLPRLLQSLILFGTTQLALMIRWARKQSIYDFGGKYQCWGIVAATCGILGLLIGCNAAHALANTRFPLGPWTFDFSSPWTWYSLVVGGWTLLAVLLWHELKRCRESLALFLFSAGLMCVSIAIVHFRYPQLDQSPSLLASLMVGTALGAPWSLFLSLWFHARYVIYVSADPPEQKEKRMSTSRSPGLISRLAGLLWPFRRKTSSAENLILETDRTIPETLPDSSTQIEKNQRVGTHDSRIDDGFDEDDAPSRPSRGRKKRRHHPEEAPIDKGMLKGLSKKERNRIRQQWREELRSINENQDAA